MSSSLAPSLLITFREALEAALIVAIVASYLKRIGKQNFNKYLYQGVLAAVIVSTLVGLGIFVVFGELSETAAEAFEGVASLLATVVLTYMILWMAQHAQNIRVELEQKIGVAITTGQLAGIIALSFVSVLREGLETVLFLTALATTDAAGTVIGIVVASAIVVALAFLIIRGTYRIDIRKFFQYTSVILVIFAAGLAGSGTHDLIEAGGDVGIRFGVLAQSAYNINPPLNPDGSYPLLHDQGAVGSIFASLVGYSGDPEWLRIIVYLAYWLIVGAYVLRTYRKSSDQS